MHSRSITDNGNDCFFFVRYAPEMEILKKSGRFGEKSGKSKLK
jgi:hypothetical protein